MKQKDFFEASRAIGELTKTNAEVTVDDQVTKTVKLEPKANVAEPAMTSSTEEVIQEDPEKTRTKALMDHFKALEEPQIDISDIEKALSLDELTDDEKTAEINLADEKLKEGLTSKKISVNSGGAIIDKPVFALNKKEFKVNEFKVHVRRPENS